MVELWQSLHSFATVHAHMRELPLVGHQTGWPVNQWKCNLSSFSHSLEDYKPENELRFNLHSARLMGAEIEG